MRVAAPPAPRCHPLLLRELSERLSHAEPCTTLWGVEISETWGNRAVGIPGSQEKLAQNIWQDELRLPWVPSEEPPRGRMGSQVSCGPCGRRDSRSNSLWTKAASLKKSPDLENSWEPLLLQLWATRESCF